MVTCSVFLAESPAVSEIIRDYLRPFLKEQYYKFDPILESRGDGHTEVVEVILRYQDREECSARPFSPSPFGRLSFWRGVGCR